MSGRNKDDTGAFWNWTPESSWERGENMGLRTVHGDGDSHRSRKNPTIKKVTKKKTKFFKLSVFRMEKSDREQIFFIFEITDLINLNQIMDQFAATRLGYA